MFGPYSFINVIGGKEEKDDVGHSRRNMVEVAVVVKILQNLYKGMSTHVICITIFTLVSHALYTMEDCTFVFIL